MGEKLSPNWDEQDSIDFMIWLMEKFGISAKKVADLLNEEGVKGKLGGKWASSSVLRTVRNPFHSNREKFPFPNDWGEREWQRLSFHPFSG